MTAGPLPAGNFSHLAGIQATRPRIGICWPTDAKSLSGQLDDALAKLYDDHCRSLLGLAALLVWGAGRAPVSLITGATATGESFPEYANNTGQRTGELSVTGLLMADDMVPGIAEEIVEDAFAAMRLQMRRLRDPDRRVAFLRRFIVTATRCVASPSAASDAGLPALSDRTLGALRELPGRQREALVLRYYAGLAEGQAAAAMGVTRASFRWHVARGMTALHLLLDPHGVASLSTA
jgi:hypothetical protein